MSTTSDQRAPRIVLAGGVNSSRLTLQALLRHGVPVAGVLGLAPSRCSQTCGYVDLAAQARVAGVPAVEFENINDPEILDVVGEWDPDLLFVVGLSQLVHRPLLDLPRRACVGYHPTALPRGRGRAPIAWLTHDGTDGAATFFVMTEAADAGGILAQEPFAVGPGDYAADVVANQSAALDRVLDRWLPELISGWWDPRPQDETRATWNARRAPGDGWIDWQRPAVDIQRLVRTASRPHPGAYTWLRGRKLIVWRAEPESGLPMRGAVGRVLLEDPRRGWLVQSGEGLLWLSEIEGDVVPTVGCRLGYLVEDELTRLAGRVAELEEQLASLASRTEGLRQRRAA